MRAESELELFTDFVALAYHEARNVRHLIRAGHLEPEHWQPFVNLPTNRVDAWRAIQPLRQRAHKASSCAGALRPFVECFGTSLADLEELYGNPNWRHARQYGGNAWQQATERIVALGEAIASGKTTEVARAIARLLECRHNTGYLKEKLTNLDEQLAHAGCRPTSR